MDMIADRSFEAFRAVSETHDAKWQRLCARYLPVTPEDSIWRYSRAYDHSDPAQGWKLHVSATILTANTVFAAVAPYLKSRGTLFKAPCSLHELYKINTGLYYGYSQVGKFITVYPRSNEEAVTLAQELHRLTCGMAAPIVPFDSRFRAGSSVFYRYGAFEPLEIENADGTRTPALRDAGGTLVPDIRQAETSNAIRVTNPFGEDHSGGENKRIENPLNTTIRAFQALAQRGKGGVYKALDLSTPSPRLCILKEGRRNGEIGWDGRDGYWRVKHEKRVLASLRAAGIEVPLVYSSFEVQDNYYLAAELISGESLQSLLLKRQRRLSVARALKYGMELATLLSCIHGAGWAWRDCKPANLIAKKDGRLRPVDFEGACSIDRLDPVPWNTPAFTSPTHAGDASESFGKDDDLYALGAVIYFLLTGQLPDAAACVPLEKLRREVPAEIRRLVAELLDANPRRRPDAQTVRRRIAAVLVASSVN